ncbi:CBS domain-containing protein [Aureimonas sp. AU4]|uniref:CBS domain-containing protein n=1 Tax=Aureimonas sp. AU4 TaxID=1638163 RepID=UPI000781075E|nr:CBS domain-containing protein [Aureimonas sp. AU4]
MKLRKLMHRGVRSVSPDTPVVEISRLMKSEDIGSVPVSDAEQLVGMITDRDIVLRVLGNGADPTELKARDIMSKTIVYCRDDETVDEALRVMNKRKIRRLPVVDDHRRMVGIVSLGDISHLAGRKAAHKLVRSVSSPHV